MDELSAYICTHGAQAPWIIFALLMLAGLNVPISEDILLITGGALAATCGTIDYYPFFILIYLGCWMSAWEAYWIGRLLGPKLYQIKWFSHVLTYERIKKLHKYYERFGILTFIVGRFIPGGVRNALFMSSGLGKMPFHLFLLRDSIACLLSTLFLFNLGYAFGENYHAVVAVFKRYSTTFLILLTFFGIGAYLVYRYRRR